MSVVRGLSKNGYELPPVVADRPRLPYPNGWFAVAFSDELSRGRVLRRRLMGEDVVIYRTHGGVVRAVEPYCPHLGAHLGYGGKVEGEEIVCPFHGFRYDTTGACVATSYGTQPPRASLTQRTVREVNGAIVIWCDVHRGPAVWELPPLPDDGFPRPATRTYTIIDHPQEVMENAVDIGHIGPVHGYQNAQIRTPIATDGQRLTLGTVAERVFPAPIGKVRMLLDFEIDGLGYIWVLARIPRVGGEALFQAWVTPIDPCRIDLRFAMRLRVMADRGAGTILSQMLTSSLASAFWSDLTKDFPIWQNKRFLERPRLAKGDGPIIQFRGWAEQFYPTSEPSNVELATASGAQRFLQ